MARRDTKNDLVKCEYCGEMYSVTYKHCPFCNEDGTGRWNEPEEDYDDGRDTRPAEGRRLAGGSRRRGNGPSVRTIIGGVLSLALIISAICIVTSLLRSILGGKSPQPQESVAPSPTMAVSAAPTEPAETALSGVTPVETAPGPATEPSTAPAPTTPAVDLTAPTGFTLSRSDFTFSRVGETYKMKVTYTPADARGDITWKSSDPNVAAVSWDGTVTAVSSGTVTLTATVAGVGEKTCIVRCNFTGGTGAATTTTPTTVTTSAPADSQPPASSGLKLSRSDFTLSSAGESWRLVVSGTSSAVTWATSDPAVATVGADGTVTAVGTGTCNVTATVDGVTLKCIVRCTWQ